MKLCKFVDKIIKYQELTKRAEKNDTDYAINVNVYLGFINPLHPKKNTHILFSVHFFLANTN